MATENAKIVCVVTVVLAVIFLVLGFYQLFSTRSTDPTENISLQLKGIGHLLFALTILAVGGAICGAMMGGKDWLQSLTQM